MMTAQNLLSDCRTRSARLIRRILVLTRDTDRVVVVAKGFYTRFIKVLLQKSPPRSPSPATPSPPSPSASRLPFPAPLPTQLNPTQPSNQPQHPTTDRR
ncbi:MAG: hypothetical protein H7237_08310, partial [Alkalinema sp. FL-bin-369]|nr:hypothetical protein [Leptolyngbyaceae cyanobacterium LF-bin-369]